MKKFVLLFLTFHLSFLTLCAQTDFYKRYADQQGKKLDNLAYHNYSSVMFNIPGTDFPIPLPYVLTFREIQLSGVLKSDLCKVQE